MLITKVRLAEIGLASVLAYMGPGRRDPQQTNPVPNSDVSFIESSSEDLIASLRLKPIDPENPLEDQIEAIAVRLAAATGFTSSVWICRGCGLSSHPGLGIIVDTDQLQRIKKQSQVQQFPAILSFLLAHEMTHQIQYRKYSSSIINLPDEERQVYEAQADILGAKYLMETMQGSAGSADTEAIIEALRVAHNLGVEQYAIADHPSQDARLTAVRLGMAAGMIVKMQRLGGAAGQASANVLISKLNFLPTEDVMSWSLRTAKRVVNYRRPDIVDLVLLDEKVDFDRDPNNPIVSYDLTYENRGARAIGVDLEVQCVAASKSDPDNIFRWEKIDASSQSFTLASRQKHTVSGTMRWAATDALKPLVVAPPRPTALITVQYSDGANPNQPQTSGITMNAQSTAASRESLDYVLAKILDNADSSFTRLRAGPGRKMGDKVIYPAYPQFPAAVRTNINIPEPGSDRDPYVYAVLSTTSDKAEAKQEFTDMASSIRTALNKLGHWTETAGEIGAGKSRYRTFRQGRLSVTVTDHFDLAAYHVSIDVTIARSGN
jgi:hypothetical protein